ERARNNRVDAEVGRFATESEETPDDEPERDAGAARIHAPAAIQRNRAVGDPPVFRARLVSIIESGIGAGVVAVRLPQGRAGHDRADADRTRLTQRAEESLGIANVRESLRVTQMRVGVHQSDLAPEERRALGALEEALRAAVVGQRAVEEAHAVRAAEVRFD